MISINRKNVITNVFAIVCLVIFALVHVIDIGNETENAIFLGAYYKPLLIAGEWWRLFTVGLVHVSLMHFLVNTLSLISLGNLLEPYLGKLKYAVVLICSVINGSLFTFALQGNIVAVGLSGGLYGLLGVFTFIALQNGIFKDSIRRNSLLRTYAINLCINFLPNVSWTAHLGGFLLGFLLGALFCNPKQKKVPLVLATAVFAAVEVFACWQNDEILENERYKLTDIHIIQKYQSLGMKNHAENLVKNLDALYGGDDIESYVKGELYESKS